MFSSQMKDHLSRSSLFVAYLLLVTGIIVGFAYMQNITDRIEIEGKVRAHENCASANEAKQVIAAVLDRLSQPREDDGPGELEERQRLRAELDDVLRPNECPPPPDDSEFS